MAELSWPTDMITTNVTHICSFLYYNPSNVIAVANCNQISWNMDISLHDCLKQIVIQIGLKYMAILDFYCLPIMKFFFLGTCLHSSQMLFYELDN